MFMNSEEKTFGKKKWFLVFRALLPVYMRFLYVYMFLPDNSHTSCHALPQHALVEPHSAKGFDHPNLEKPKQMEDFADPVQLDPDRVWIIFESWFIWISCEKFESFCGLPFDVQLQECH